MSLSCDCGYDDYEFYYGIGDGLRIAETEHRCYGCGKQGHENDRVRQYYEYTMDEDEYGDQTGEETVIRYRRICEECGDLYDSLIELGFCLTSDYMFIADAMNDYRENYVKQPL